MKVGQSEALGGTRETEETPPPPPSPPATPNNMVLRNERLNIIEASVAADECCPSFPLTLPFGSFKRGGFYLLLQAGAEPDCDA